MKVPDGSIEIFRQDETTGGIVHNDIFGHEVGDALIIKAAEILVHSCQADDMVARIGGDEFVLLLPQTDMGNVQKLLIASAWALPVRGSPL